MAREISKPRLKKEQSLTYDIQKPPIFFAYVARFVKRSRTLLIEATEVLLNVVNVELKILMNEVSKFPRRSWITRSVRAYRRDAALCPCLANQSDRQDDTPRKSRTTQLEVSQTPYFLEYTHFECLMDAQPNYSRRT